MPKYITQGYIARTCHKVDTIEIRIQGGIVAVNGFTGIFMVQSVLATATVDKVKRDSDKSKDKASGRKRENSLFSQVLEEKKEEQKAAAMNCHTVTYGRDCRIRNFQYQSGEYRY